MRKCIKKKDDVKNELKRGNATAQDLGNAEKGLASMVIASNMPSIVRNLPLIGAAAFAYEMDQLLAPRFNHIQEQFNVMNGLLNQIDGRLNQID